MATAALFPFFIGLLTSATVCGAWWYAAIRKRGVPIFYWLAAAHTLTFGIHVYSVIIISTQTNYRSMASVGAMQTLMGVVLAGLYVALVRWLVRGDES